MFRPRVIPVLLLKGRGLVKTVKFDKNKYVGDPINAVRIFNDLEADELTFLDITATNENRTISMELVKQIGDEAFMPFGVGGGVKNILDVKKLLKAGAEKVIINSSALENPNLIKNAAEQFGNQSVIVSIDVRKSLFGNYIIYSHSGTKKWGLPLSDHLQKMEELGAGEIIINSIDNDGLMKGYDLELISTVSAKLKIPVIACGGAGQVSDFKKAYYTGGASAVAAGSRFVFHGPRNAVLINYPEKEDLMKLFNGKM